MRVRLAARIAGVCLATLCAGACRADETTDADDTAAWSRPRSEERKDDRLRMVRRQMVSRGIADKRVLGAMRSVPRHWFVPGDLQRAAYDDRPLPIGHGQTISQPYIVAKMTELLKLTATDKALEVGTGSGYQAAVLSELTPNVFTVEIIEPLATAAAKRFRDRGYATVKTKRADGYFGWEGEGPFDAIIVTAASPQVPPPLLKQLKPGGRMVIPVGQPFRIQQLMLITRDDKGKLRTRVIAPVRFVPLTGGPRRRK